MKIIQAGVFPLDENKIHGGVETSIYGLSMELAKFHDLVVVDYPRNEVDKDFTERIKNVLVYRFSSKYNRNSAGLIRVFRMCKLILASNATICHIHSTGWISLILYLFLKLNSIPVVVTIHGLAYVEKRQSLMQSFSAKNFFKFVTHSFAEFVLVNFSTHIIVDTKYVADMLLSYKKKRKIFKLPTIYVIPQGIHEKYYSISRNVTSTSLLAVGCISPRKGYLKLINVIKKVVCENSNVKLDIVGIVSDFKYMSEMVKSIKQNSLENNVFIHSNVDFEEVIAYYSRASIFVLHSQEESQGIVFCEAMASGLPIVATDVGGVSCVVKNGQGGLLSNYGNETAFANNILLLMSDNELAVNYSQFNKNESVRYKWSSICLQIIEVYSQLINIR